MQMTHISTRAPKELKARLEAQADNCGVDLSVLIRAGLHDLARKTVRQIKARYLRRAA